MSTNLGNKIMEVPDVVSQDPVEREDLGNTLATIPGHILFPRVTSLPPDGSWLFPWISELRGLRRPRLEFFAILGTEIIPKLGAVSLQSNSRTCPVG